MLKMSSTWIVLQFLIYAANNNEVSKGEDNGNKTNLSNSFTSKKSTRASYPTFKGAKKGGTNTKKGVKTARNSNYLTLGNKKSLIFYGTHLYKRLSFNILILNDMLRLRLTCQAMLLV